MTPMNVDKNATDGGSISPVIGAVIKIHEYQTPEENWGMPATESQTIFKEAKTVANARNRLRLNIGFIEFPFLIGSVLRS